MKKWLMKAEPDSRVVKGKDVKFSVDDFEEVGTTPWEGVRNAEARNLMKEMKVGDQVLFYHSNCKNPGIAAFAEVSKEAYPDYTAWDVEHPYHDAKTDKNNPKWYMVDVIFKSKLKHFVPLSLLKEINITTENKPPPYVEYIGGEGVTAIQSMTLLNRGRLSVQRVEDNAWAVVENLAETGGWEESLQTKPKARGKSAKREPTTENRNKNKGEGADLDSNEQASEEKKEIQKAMPSKKRKAIMPSCDAAPARRSTRARKC